ncbi:MAG: putative secondary metabolism biosynthetic enzyme [Chrysothrix sp. TS-e1954]|nr:MAG: putative secondary metabolism biosynthetic enzyme [Chrysothrix sp. TS-e1954]
MAPNTVAIVTGTSRGIGEAIVRLLATEPPKVPLVIYAASRKGVKLDVKPAADVEVNYQKLDIADTSTIGQLFDEVTRKHKNIDVLINNAGVNMDDRYSPQNVRTTLNTNVRGTLQMCRTFIPVLSKEGRIVNVSSTGSALGLYSRDIQQRFRSSKMTLDDLESMMQEYQTYVDQGTETKHGWPQQAYSVSKAFTNALTAVLARDTQGLTINSCCPGWVATDMGTMVGARPSKKPEDGATIPIRLGFGSIDGVTGRYWGNPSISSTGDGQVQAW